MERGPIFIAGLERSGTSLIFALLATHPTIAMTRRTNLWTYFYNQYGDLRQPANLDRCLDMMAHYKRLHVLKPDYACLRQKFLEGEQSYPRLFALLEEQYAERLGKPRWGDKSLNTERYADLIFAAYPGARILHMIRDPRDRYASVITRWKVRRGGIGAGTAMWLLSNALGEENQQRYPEQYKIIRYEALAAQPEQTLRAICAFIDEEYAPTMLTMEGAKTFRDEGGNSSYGQRKPGVISTDSIGRYRKILSKQEIAFVQRYAGKEMVNCAYPMDAIQFTARERLRFLLVDWPLNRARMMGWYTINAWENRVGRALPTYRIIDPNKDANN